MFTLIDSDKSVKFSAKGSGVWLNTPFISEFMILYCILSLSSNLGIAIDPPELIASALTESLSSLISSSGNIFKFKIASTWSSISLSYSEIVPRELLEEKIWFFDSEYSINLDTSSLDKNSPSELKNFKPLYSSGLWLAVIISPPTESLFNTPQQIVGVVDKPASITLIPIELNVELTIDWIILPDFLPSLPVITVRLDELGLFSLINLENAEIDVTISVGVKFSRLFPPIVPLNPDIFFIKVIWNVNI